MTAEVKLNELELKEIVAEGMRAKGYKASATDVRFDTTTEFQGYGKNEHEITRVCCYVHLILNT